MDFYNKLHADIISLYTMFLVYVPSKSSKSPCIEISCLIRAFTFDGSVARESATYKPPWLNIGLGRYSPIFDSVCP